MIDDRFDQLGKAMGAAWFRVKKAQARLWSEWMTIGEGLLAGRQWAMQMASTNKPEGKGYVTAYSEWLKRYKVDDMDKSDRAKLLQLMEERPSVEEWRATLTDHEKRNLNNPIVVWRKWTAATRVRKPKPRPAATPAQAAYEAQARVVELEEELRELQATRDEDPGEEATLESLRNEIDALHAELAQAKERIAELEQDLQGAPKQAAESVGKDPKQIAERFGDRKWHPLSEITEMLGAPEDEVKRLLAGMVKDERRSDAKTETRRIDGEKHYRFLCNAEAISLGELMEKLMPIIKDMEAAAKNQVRMLPATLSYLAGKLRQLPGRLD